MLIHPFGAGVRDEGWYKYLCLGMKSKLSILPTTSPRAFQASFAQIISTENPTNYCTMVDGGCVCGAVRIKTTGEVAAKVRPYSRFTNLISR